MGRELRMVPDGWEHPKYPADYYEPHLRGRYIPLLNGSFQYADQEWTEGWTKWQEGYVEDYGAGDKWRERTPEHGLTYTLYAGPRPSPDDYMPNWPKETMTKFMMYEDTTEGTPISPAFDTAEELARWLTDNGASAFGDMTATYEEWLATINQGFAVGMVVADGKIMSGVEAMASGNQ